METVVRAPIEKVWVFRLSHNTSPSGHLLRVTGHAPDAENDLSVNGNYKTTMAALTGALVSTLKAFTIR